MTKRFTKRQLLNQCAFTAEEANIILEYQKKLPILLEDIFEKDINKCRKH